MNHTILPPDTSAALAAQVARASHCGLYLTRHGQTIVAPHAQPGWQRIAVGVKNIQPAGGKK